MNGKNSDGGIGTQGWAKISVFLRNSFTKKKIPLLKKENVPPQGVIIAGPHIKNLTFKPGDQILIENDFDNLNIMGVRIGYN